MRTLRAMIPEGKTASATMQTALLQRDLIGARHNAGEHTVTLRLAPSADEGIVRCELEELGIAVVPTLLQSIVARIRSLFSSTDKASA